MPRRARLFTVLALLAVATVNAAGIWSIAAFRREAAEEAARRFAEETQRRARGLERLVAATRADLAFLAGSAPVSRLLTSPAEPARLPREAAEAALLLFLRAHPEVTRVSVRDARSRLLLLAGRRGGVPILWVASNPTGSEGPAVSSARPRLGTHVPFEGAAGAVPPPDQAAGLAAEIAPEVLLGAHDTEADPGGADRERPCRLLDGAGAVLGRSAPPLSGPTIDATADFVAEGWSAPSPWHLRCEQPRQRALSQVEPMTARYRTTLALSLGAMAMAALLGVLAVREVRQRARFEAQAHEEARVRELERQLFHAERLTTAGRLAAGIAHEINNPLEGMTNYLSLTRDALDRGDLEGARRRLERVREGLDRAALVVRQVLAHADSARAPREPVDLNRVLAEAVEFVGSRPEFSRVRFETALSEGPLVVEGNRVMLGQVALNIIVNACEAQPEGGEVRVTSSGAGGRVLAEVADRGPGITAAERERIFEPFFSTKNSSGLGLSICHAIVRQHGGDIEALPGKGGGTVFRVGLPVAPEAHARPEAG